VVSQILTFSGRSGGKKPRAALIVKAAKLLNSTLPKSIQVASDQSEELTFWPSSSSADPDEPVLNLHAMQDRWQLTGAWGGGGKSSE
jgi:hypothetical protein